MNVREVLWSVQHVRRTDVCVLLSCEWVRVVASAHKMNTECDIPVYIVSQTVCLICQPYIAAVCFSVY